jgi:hypothetical protein
VRLGDTGPNGRTLRDAETDIVSDIAISIGDGGLYSCDGCKLPGPHLLSKGKMLEHLKRHKKAGDKIPDFVFKAIEGG